MSVLLTCALALAPLPVQDEIEVRIRRIGGGSVAGAQVRWWTASGRVSERIPTVDLQAIDEIARRAGNMVEADETGRVCLPFEPRRYVVASLPGWWGVSEWRDGWAEPEVKLYPDRELTVLVTGADGKPLGGVPVHLLQDRPTEGLVEVRESSFLCGAVRSGNDDGIARLSHFDFVRLKLVGGRPLYVRLNAFPESSGARARVPDAINDMPLVLSAANLTQVSIEAVDKDGRPVGQTFEAALVHDPKAASNSSPSSPIVARELWAIETNVPGGKPHIRASTLESETSFDCVDVAAGLVALARRNTLSDWSGRLVDRHAAGGAQRVPLQLGEGCESVVASLKLGDAPITEGTVRVRRGVSPQDLSGPVRGAPRVDGALRSFWESGLLAWTDGYWTEWAELPLSELRVDFAPAARATTGLLGITTHTPDGMRRFALVDVRARTPRAEHRVEVDLTNCDQTITGAIEDGSGRPVPDAVVHLELPLQPEGSLLDPTYGPCIRLWSEVTDGHGRFQLPCPEKGPFRVVATSADQFVEVFRDGVPAGANLSLQLSPRGGVRGVLRTTGALGSADLNVLLLRYAFADDKQPSSGFTLGCSCEGEFEFKNAREGRYTLIVRRARGRAPPIELLRVEDVEVTVGEVTDLGELRIE